MKKPKMTVPVSELDDLLMHIEAIFDGWHSDGTAWSEYDESVRQRIYEYRLKYTTTFPIKDRSISVEHMAKLCTLIDNKNKEIAKLKSDLINAVLEGVEHGKSIMAYYQLNGFGEAPLTPESFANKYLQSLYCTIELQGVQVIDTTKV